VRRKLKAYFFAPFIFKITFFTIFDVIFFAKFHGFTGFGVFFMQNYTLFLQFLASFFVKFLVHFPTKFRFVQIFSAFFAKFITLFTFSKILHAFQTIHVPDLKNTKHPLFVSQNYPPKLTQIHHISAFLIGNFKPMVEQRMCTMIENIINRDMNGILSTMPLKVTFPYYRMPKNTSNKKFAWSPLLIEFLP
jgi:hypothetical protein